MLAARRPSGRQRDPWVMRLRLGGVAAILAGVAALVVVALEEHRSSLGFNDADDPRVMLRFFRQHPDVYTASGLALVVVGIGLAVAVVALWRVTSVADPGLLVRVGAVFGLFSSAFFFAQGVLRVQSPGTILHIADLDEQSGMAAYAAVQMAGTQGFGSAGGFSLAIWAIALALGTWRERTLPRALAVLAVPPAAFLLIGLLGSLILSDTSQVLRLVYIASVVLGLPLWCMGVGAALLRLKPSPSQVPR
jgi:hypothetical protein